jgi:branched-chain amino acid transport system permease protein
MLTYAVFILVVAGVYALLAQSLTLSWGLAGLVNLGLAGFFAVGAYASALATTGLHVPGAGGLVLAMAAGAGTGLLVARATSRLTEDYLAIVTLGFAELVRIVASNEIWLTGGTDGISGIPGLFPRDWSLGFHFAMLALVSTAVGLTFFLVDRVARSPFGRVLMTIREDQVVAAVAGKDVARFKAQAFAMSASIAALAGGLYGHYTSYVAPDMFQPLITIYIFLAVTAGGRSRPLGALVGAYGLVLLLEATRFGAGSIPGISAPQAAALREFAVGAALVILLRLKPAGLLAERRPRMRHANGGPRT